MPKIKVLVSTIHKFKNFLHNFKSLISYKFAYVIDQLNSSIVTKRCMHHSVNCEVPAPVKIIGWITQNQGRGVIFNNIVFFYLI